MVTEPQFKFIAGNLALDFVNTVDGRVTIDRKDELLRDKLSSVEDLVEWGVEAQLLSGTLPAGGAAATTVFKRAVLLRETLYRLFKTSIERRSPLKTDLDALNRELVSMRVHERFDFTNGRFAWTWDSPKALEGMLWVIVRSAVEFLSSPMVQSLRQCPGDECGWMFLDLSRNRSRQWCEMRVCGNRAKARRFRDLHR